MGHSRRQYPNRLKMARQDVGLEQRQVADLLGLTVISLCNWENEKAMPSGTNLIKLCTLYGCDTRELYPECYLRIAKDVTTL